MSVLDWYKSEANQFYWGKYLGKKADNGYNQDSPKQFRYEIISPKDKRYIQIVQNLITHDASMIIKTTWNLGFVNQGVIIDSDNQKHLITNIRELIEEEESQVNALIRDSHKTYYLELS